MMIYKTLHFEMKDLNTKKHFSTVKICGRSNEELEQRCENTIRVMGKRGYSIRK